MNKKWIDSLVLCTFLWCMACSPVIAALSSASFIPCKAGIGQAAGGLYQSYCVRAGDNLWNISRSYHVDLQTLMLCNNLDSKSVLRVGQTLKLPSGQGRVHTIRRGETLWDIARHYHISLNQLRQLNPDKKASNLTIGDQINLPRGTSRLAVATSSVQPSRSIAARFAWPIRGSITSTYGWRSSGFHHGLDVAGDLGDPVRASAGGVVSFTGNMGLYGNTVIIDHTGGMQTLYAHLQTIKIKSGDRVRGGEVIASVGNTGRSTGPHLHFEIRRDSERYDPLAYLR